jgi:hypothetical protein
MRVMAVTIVITGPSWGMTMYHARWNQLAPSIFAASTWLTSTFCRAAKRITTTNPVAPGMAETRTA